MKVFKPFTSKGVKDLATMTKRGQNVTHGDLLIVRCDESDFPVNFDSLPDAELGVLAEGEHSGHAHQLFVDEAPEVSRPAFEVITGGNAAAKYTLKKADNNELFLRVESDTMLLKHQEHVPFRLYKGNYHIGIQVETAPFEEDRRAVAD